MSSRRKDFQVALLLCGPQVANLSAEEWAALAKAQQRLRKGELLNPILRGDAKAIERVRMEREAGEPVRRLERPTL